MTWTVRFTPVAINSIKEIPDRRIQEAIRARAALLSENPAEQGKPLRFELSGYLRVKVLDRYRIIYRLQSNELVVAIVLAGIRKASDRKDVYEVARRLRAKGLL